MTPHIESKLEDIAEIVLMPGDPLRAKYIADTYLKNVKEVNKVRNMTAYTGYYKDKRITVFPSGMGIPSVGIYAYELYKFYNVKKIIRIGTCGSNHPDIKISDIILADSAYSESTFVKVITQKEEKIITGSINLLNQINDTAKKNNINLIRGPIYTSDIFDVYFNIDHILEGKNLLASEMECYGLYFIAKYLNKEAATLITVVDSKYDKTFLSSEERQNNLNTMIKLALESI